MTDRQIYGKADKNAQEINWENKETESGKRKVEVDLFPVQRLSHFSVALYQTEFVAATAASVATEKQLRQRFSSCHHDVTLN